MKSLVVFYSLEGNTKLIAETIAREVGGDLLEIKVVKEYPNSGLKKYFWGGKSVMLKEKPDLVPFKLEMEKYDNVFIGTPIWAYTFAAPFNTFIDKVRIINKNIAVFICHGGGGIGKCYESFRKNFPGNNFLGYIDFDDPAKKSREESIEKTRNWIKTLPIR